MDNKISEIKKPGFLGDKDHLRALDINESEI